MEDFDCLIIEVYKWDFKIIMDIVVNYMLIEYEWF